MFGSYTDVKEKFHTKKKDNSKKALKKADREWRERRRNRHEEVA